MTKKPTLNRWRVASKPKAKTEGERKKYLMGVAFFHHYNAWHCDYQAKHSDDYEMSKGYLKASSEHIRLWHEAMEIANDLLTICPWDIWDEYEKNMVMELQAEDEYEIDFYINNLKEIWAERQK